MMLTAPKPFASLSSGLLARKGQARPAMRRQMSVLEVGAHAGDDLGWNDMGEPLPSPVEEVVAAREIAPPPPAVLTQREELAESLDATIEPVAEPVRMLVAAGRRAAFTLRLDPERHLRLRLASATRRVSAQRLVTQALDDFLKTMPELDALAERVPGTATDRVGD